MIRFTKVLCVMAMLALAGLAPSFAQEGGNAAVADAESHAPGDTSYRVSDAVSARVQRRFLSEVRWAAGLEMRAQLEKTFAERKPADLWQDIVAKDGLTIGNVADALTAYWVLNWIAANAAYGVVVDARTVQAQVREAMANDPKFPTIGDQKRQETAEGYILNFLLEYGAMHDALNRKDSAALMVLASAAVRRFRQQMGIDLLSLVPGPKGFEPRPHEAAQANGSTGQ